MPTNSLGQIITDAAGITDKEERVNFLRKNDTPALRQILELGLNPQIRWDLPEGAPPFKRCDLLDVEGRLYGEMRTMYIYLEGGNPALNKVKREMLYIGLLESIDPRDADLLIMIKDKKLPKSINAKVVNEAFPGLINEQID